MASDEPSPEQLRRLVDALLTDLGIPVEASAAAFDPAPASAGHVPPHPSTPPLASAPERFWAALEQAAAGGTALELRAGKIRGEVTKAEAQRALRLLDELPPELRRAAARSALEGAWAKTLSPAARELIEAAASP